MPIQTRINLPLDAIHTFCRRWNIVEFALFGSVPREDFAPSSDIDALATFREETRYNLSDLAQMGDEPEAIFGREVDLIDRATVEASRNDLRRRQILNSAQVVYAER